MHLRSASCLVLLVGLIGLASAGCESGTDVKLATPSGEVKPVPPPKPEQLKGAAKRSVGPGSSANVGKMGKNPMELAR
jgi:hypothetical protein